MEPSPIPLGALGALRALGSADPLALAAAAVDGDLENGHSTTQAVSSGGSGVGAVALPAHAIVLTLRMIMSGKVRSSSVTYFRILLAILLNLISVFRPVNLS